MDLFGMIGGAFGGAINEIGKVAPVLAQAVTGNVPGALNEVAKICGVDVGMNEKEKKQKIAEALKDSPELVYKMENAQIELEKKLSDNGLDLRKLLVQSTKNAQDMYVQTKDKTVPTLAYISVIGFIAVCACLFFVDIPQGNRDIIIQLVGNIFGLVAAVFTFYFGSSSGSRSKDDKIANMSK